MTLSFGNHPTCIRACVLSFSYVSFTEPSFFAGSLVAICGWQPPNGSSDLPSWYSHPRVVFSRIGRVGLCD